MTRYSLCSEHLKSWVLEGSNDDSEWHQLDRKDDNEDLRHPGLKYMGRGQASFAVTEHGEYRFVRLRQTGENHEGNDVFSVRMMEFFGTLSEHMQL